MSNRTPISRDSELCKVIPPVVDKHIVDLVNSVEVIGGQLRVQEQRSGMAKRLYDGITGKGARRQTKVNASLRQAAESSLHWLEDLTLELSGTNRELVRHGIALEQVNLSVARLYGRVGDLATYAKGLASDLERLGEMVKSEVGELEARLQKVEAQGEAQGHLDNVMSRWGARRYDRLSVLGRSYAALEDLRWGFFGQYCRLEGRGSQLLETAANRVMKCMADDLGLSSPNERTDTSAWLRPDEWEDGSEALAYLAEDYGQRMPPLVAVASGSVPLEGWPGDVPIRASASRLAEELVETMFQSGHSGELT